MKPLLIGVAVLAAVALGLGCLPPLLLAATLAAADSASTPASELAEREIPLALLARYQQAPACAGLPWQVVAAIGHEETRHATFARARLNPVTGDVAPPIVGIALNGARGTAAIRVPAGGSAWHDDPVWDHAVGPMQFITGTWSQWGRDGSGDGIASPHNAFDAIAAAGRYLCGGKQRLTGTDAIEAAVGRYNRSSRYVKAVMDKAYAYGMVDGGDLGAGAPPMNPGAGGPVVSANVRPVVDYARAQIGDPYVWGAEGPDSFDCSGLTLAAYRQVGIRLPHRSALQVRYGRPIDWRTEPIRAGDLLFMRGSIPVQDYGHVGIAVDDQGKNWINAARRGVPVREGPIPYARLQAVRRLVIN